MKKILNLFITTLLITFLSVLLSSCTQTKTVNLKTFVLDQKQIDFNYPINTVIESPKLNLNQNQEFKGWYIGKEKVSFPYKLEKDTILIASIEENNNINNNNNIINSTENKNNNTNTTNKVIITGNLKTDFNGYYKDITATNGKDLFFQLSDLLNTYPISYNTSYNQVWDVIRQADIRPEVSTEYISGIYGYYFTKDKRLVRSLSPDSNEHTYNREHVWPQSRLGISKSEKAKGGNKAISTDAHNLRASGEKINAKRSSDYFVDGKGRAHTANGGFYPGDMSKGDVARILLYMAVRYKDQIKLTSKIRPLGYGTRPGYMGNLSLLNKWHEEDKPDQLEKNRNDVIFRYQKNRNPFIDHPEWVKPVWDYLVSVDR